jgi:hypothetical protein
VAHIFGAGKLEPTRKILRAYIAAGGDITWSGQDLFLSVARHDLQVLFERIQVSLERIPAPRWMEDSRAIEQSIGVLLREFPDKIDRLNHLASKVSDVAGRDGGAAWGCSPSY